MADVLHRITRVLKKSVNTTDYSPAEWIINPDMSSVEGFSYIYWIITGDAVSLMDEAARTLVDQQISADQLNEDREIEKSKITDNKSWVASLQVIRSEINILRVEAGLIERTAAQMRNAILQEIDNG